MKYLLGLLGITLSAYLYSMQTHEPLLSPEPTPATSPSSGPNKVMEKMTAVTIADTTYRYTWNVITEPKNLILYPNFDQKMGSSQLIIEKHCQLLVNGGFYTEGGQPIGWFVTEGKEQSPRLINRLLNGQFWIGKSGNNFIGINDKDLVGDDIYSGLQTGPLLMKDNQLLELLIKNDKPRRRMVATRSSAGELILLAITSDSSFFEGPLLQTLPAVIEAIGTKENTKINAAVNLDGGSASAFYSDKIHIKEATWIGSYFCLGG